MPWQFYWVGLTPRQTSQRTVQVTINLSEFSPLNTNELIFLCCTQIPEGHSLASLEHLDPNSLNTKKQEQARCNLNTTCLRIPPPTLQTKKSPDVAVWGPILLVLSEFGVERPWPCPVYMDHFKWLLPTDAEDVLGGTRTTSCELACACPSLQKPAGGDWEPLWSVVPMPLFRMAGFWILFNLKLSSLCSRSHHLMLTPQTVITCLQLPFSREGHWRTKQFQMHLDVIGFLDPVSLAFTIDTAQRMYSRPLMKIFAWKLTGETALLIWLNPSGAFNTLDHEVLIKYLHDLVGGRCSPALNCSELILFFPTGKMPGDGNGSVLIILSGLPCGVPHSYILSSFLFHVYMSLLGECVKIWSDGIDPECNLIDFQSGLINAE